jgi:hypothetical protein
VSRTFGMIEIALAKVGPIILIKVLLKLNASMLKWQDDYIKIKGGMVKH